MTLKQEELKYTKEHEWVFLDGNTALVGITDYASEQLGDVVHVELPQLNDEHGKGDAFGTVESVKSVSDLYMPVGGKILEVNEILLENSGVINEDPFGEGWIAKVEITDPADAEDLLSFEQYQSFLSEEA